MNKLSFGIVVSALAISIAVPAAAQTSQRIAFARGNDNAAVSGAISGRQYKDYIVNARAGQRLGASLVTGNPVCYFNILPPGGDGTALYNSSIDGNDATNIKLPRSGDYRIRVYLMGTRKPAKYTLSVSVMN